MITPPDGLPRLIDLEQPEYVADPYPLYHRLRALDPVRWERGTWVLTRYADVAAVLRDPRFSARRLVRHPIQFPRQWRPPLVEANRTLSNWILFMDRLDHTRLRSLVNSGFSARMAETLRPRIQQIVDGLLDARMAAGRMDVICDLSYSLPLTVIGELLGLPREDHGRLLQWSGDIAAFLGGFGAEEDRIGRIFRSIQEVTEYLGHIVAQRRSAPRNDMISALVAAQQQARAPGTEELVGNCLLILFGGHETMAHLIGNGLLALLRHPEPLQQLREDPSLAGSAVEELLRYDCLFQITVRVAREAGEIGGKRIKPGQHVTLLGAANRDPLQFPNPDRLELGRRDNRHLAFGHGVHFCLGAALARLEAEIAIQTLLRRLPGLHLQSETPLRRPNPGLRGLLSLPVSWDSVQARRARRPPVRPRLPAPQWGSAD